MINPFIDRSNLEVYRSGNPDLKPEYINSFDLEYNVNRDKTVLGFTAFYKHIANPINSVILLDDKGISHMAPQNMSSSQNYGLEFTFEQSIYNWWKINGNASFFRNLIRADVFNTLKNRYTSWGSNFTADNWRKTETQVPYFSISYSFGSNGNSKSSKSIITNESKPSTEM